MLLLLARAIISMCTSSVNSIPITPRARSAEFGAFYVKFTPFKETLAVRTYLKDCEGSAREHDMNSWKAAMFAALADNEWYCGGGFDVVAF